MSNIPFNVKDKVTLNPEMGYSEAQCKIELEVSELWEESGVVTCIPSSFKGCYSLHHSHFKLAHNDKDKQANLWG
jgi:hypothetical protein